MKNRIDKLFDIAVDNYIDKTDFNALLWLDEDDKKEMMELIEKGEI